ncbi:hypothetical protein GGTG_08773 [Gaeumannomyces tritici R3-111a-1]|uniref:Chitin-binding type-1 domain-containing protein n=1 Tax=Gaeumannomyces tritici (strain R3-111a-1) TaxID=644352 RepID=J3P5I4_GAET3|nr:hypothetical protein GGTG_08773 [Gaeumannomyces tritici R3-111a-1]EJT74935.1 hypothetical protein GGTG_08773 [Gaeumannomyces tritici R3-111a-1]
MSISTHQPLTSVVFKHTTLLFNFTQSQSNYSTFVRTLTRNHASDIHHFQHPAGPRWRFRCCHLSGRNLRPGLWQHVHGFGVWQLLLQVRLVRKLRRPLRKRLPVRLRNLQRSHPSGRIRVSDDGTCGTGVTCMGSEFGNCCSSSGRCGSTDDYCGAGCQTPFGQCGGGGASASGSPSASASASAPASIVATDAPGTATSAPSATGTGTGVVVI